MSCATESSSNGGPAPAVFATFRIALLTSVAVVTLGASQLRAQTAEGTSTVAKTGLGAGGVHIAGAKSLTSTEAGEETIVEVYLRRTEKLSSGMVAHLQGEDMLVPLEEIAVLLEFAITESPEGAKGWFIEERRKFHLDLRTNEVRSDGQVYKLKPGEARRIDKQLFVSARALSQWLPLNFQADMRALALQVSPREITPREARAARNTDKKYGSIHQFRSEYPKVHVPYALAQIPGLEVDLGVGYGGRALNDKGTRLFTGGSVRMFGDFLYMNGEVFVTGTDRGVVDARARFGRVDPDGGLLGALNATAWHIGDVSATTIPLVSHGLSGRGVHLTSRPLSYVAEFDRVTIEDSVPVGHEVELYRNGILMASQPPSTTGRFKFESVPLHKGTNEIRLEFYGPQGQRRTDTRQYVVGDQQLPVGRLNYEFTVNEVGRSLFGYNNWSRDHHMYYDNTSIGGAARFDYGLSRTVSLTGGFVAAPLPARVKDAMGDNYRYYATLGSRMMVGNFAINLDGAADDRGGVAAGAGVSTVVKGWNVSARHERFMNDFASDAGFAPFRNVGTYAYRTSNTTARADTVLSDLWPGVYFNVGVLGGYTTYDSIDPSWRVGVTAGFSAGRLSVSNDLFYGGAITRGNEGIFGSVRANLRLFNDVNLRASADYDLRGTAEVQGVSIGLSTMLPYDVNFGIGYARRFDYLRDNDFNESYFASLRRKFGIAEIGLLASYNRYDPTDLGQSARVDDYRVGVTVAFSTMTDPRTLQTFMSSERIARQGAIRPQVFYDGNQNSIMDINERQLENVRVGYMGQRDPFQTGGARQLMGPVNPGNWTDVAVDRSSLDPSLTPSRGYAVLPRPGVVSDVVLPVFSTAGVEGRVNLLMNKQRRALPNIKVQIVKKEAAGEKIVTEVNTEFDGTFSIGSVPVGAYTLRIEPEQAKQIGARGPVEAQINLTPETKILDGIELSFTRS